MESSESVNSSSIGTQLTIQQVGGSAIQLIAQDPNNPGKGIYIIDQNQANALQMFTGGTAQVKEPVAQREIRLVQYLLRLLPRYTPTFFPN